jgi:hypothetical protein
MTAASRESTCCQLVWTLPPRLLPVRASNEDWLTLLEARANNFPTVPPVSCVGTQKRGAGICGTLHFLVIKVTCRSTTLKPIVVGIKLRNKGSWRLWVPSILYNIIQLLRLCTNVWIIFAINTPSWNAVVTSSATLLWYWSGETEVPFLYLTTLYRVKICIQRRIANCYTTTFCEQQWGDCDFLFCGTVSPLHWKGWGQHKPYTPLFYNKM